MSSQVKIISPDAPAAPELSISSPKELDDSRGGFQFVPRAFGSRRVSQRQRILEAETIVRLSPVPPSPPSSEGNCECGVLRLFLSLGLLQSYGVSLHALRGQWAMGAWPHVQQCQLSSAIGGAGRGTPREFPSRDFPGDFADLCGSSPGSDECDGAGPSRRRRRRESPATFFASTAFAATLLGQDRHLGAAEKCTISDANDGDGEGQLTMNCKSGLLGLTDHSGGQQPNPI